MQNNTPAKSWEQRDLSLIWHPCSQMKDYETLPPIVVDHGKGVWLYDIHGKRYMDIVSSWWANLLGHCQPEINAAIKAQLDDLEHVIFANFSHRPAIELAEQLDAITPERIHKFHFNDNGSSAVECALKMSFQFYHQTGKPEKKRFMCLSEGYHGETIGALSVGSMDLFAKLYKPMMMDNIHVTAPDCYRCPYGKTREHCACECFEHAEKAFAAHAQETAAIIVEPLLQGCAGMRIYPPLYLKKLRQLCDTYDVLLIADEIATGFGRTGKLFASEWAGITPDIMCVGKGLTGGMMTGGAVLAKASVAEGIEQAGPAEGGGVLMHGPTFMGNPLFCAAACASLDLLQASPWQERVQAIEQELKAGLEPCRNLPGVRDVRCLGAIGVVEVEKEVDMAVLQDFFIKKGVWIRPFNHNVYLMPPFVTPAEDVARLCGAIREAVERRLA